MRVGRVPAALVQLQAELGDPVARMVVTPSRDKPGGHDQPDEEFVRELCSNPYYGLAYDDPRWGRMCYVPSRRTSVGASDDDLQAYSAERPQRLVLIPAFWMQRDLATPEQATIANLVEDGTAVVQVSWDDCQRMLGAEESVRNDVRALRGGSWGSDSWLCRASRRYWGPPGFRSDLLGFRVVLSSPQDAFLPSSVSPSYRLPLEDEFEHAARGWDTRIYPWGNGWIEDRSERLSKPSPWGIRGLCGEVWQWCQDAYVADRSVLSQAGETKT
jgi:formylglycine-generating enzyme required for sulfatase activity